MTSTNADIRPRISLHPPLLAGTAVALAFFAGFGGWAATAPLAGAAVAPALVAPEGDPIPEAEPGEQLTVIHWIWDSDEPCETRR